MKHFTLTLISCAMFLICDAQRKAYDTSGKKYKVSGEYATIQFTPSKAKSLTVGRESAATQILSTLVDFGFEYVDSLLQKRVKSFSNEFTARQTYVAQPDQDVPNFTIKRTITTSDNKEHDMLVEFETKSFGTNLPVCYFQLKSIQADLTRARLKKGDRLDYTIELKPTFLVIKDGKQQKEAVEMKPILVTSVELGDKTIGTREVRSDAVLIPSKGVFIELDVKISETNPRKVKAETLLQLWTKHQESLKKLVTQYIPNGGAGGGGGNPDEPVKNQ